MTNSDSAGIERPRFFQGQLLTAQDFADEQDYFREKLHRHNRLLHGCGVVCGLHVTPAAEGCAVVVSPGYALDPCGDEIVLEAEVVLPLSRSAGPTPGPSAACPDAVWYAAIRYAEVPTAFIPVPGADVPQPSRIRESHEMLALAALPSGYEPGARGRADPSSGCPPCPPNPDARWVVLAEIRVRRERITVHELRPWTPAAHNG
jgi:hypothetical protein